MEPGLRFVGAGPAEGILALLYSLEIFDNGSRSVDDLQSTKMSVREDRVAELPGNLRRPEVRIEERGIELDDI